MLPARFKALNADSDEESKGEDYIPTITKEALEEKALSQYTEALTMSRDGKFNEAERAFTELIESDLLTKTTGKVTFIAGRIKPSLVHLKYCCYLNLGHVYFNKEEYTNALDSYRKAVDLDDTDLNLLYKIGLVGMKMADIEIAISAFEDALEISPNHWPSLDNLITALYAGGGHLACLYYISKGLERDQYYEKGLVYKERIFKNHPSLKEHYNLFYPENKLDPEAHCDLPLELKEKYYAEVEVLMARRKHQMSLQVKVHKPTPEYKIPQRPETWQQLANIIVNANKQFSAEAFEQDFFRPINLLFEADTANCSLEMEVDIEDVDDGEDEEVDKINNEASGNENEEVSENLGIRAKRRRSSPTYLEQWMSGKRRSARVRSTVRKEEPSLARTLSSLIPVELLPVKDDGKKEESFRFDDSMDTMDLYKLFENKDGCDSESVKMEKIYYNPSVEERERCVLGSQSHHQYYSQKSSYSRIASEDDEQISH